MQLETLFTEQKWNILRSLAHEPQSPLQLSEKLNTTMANVSQQLKLLEAVNLVKKQKIKNREKGKPRTLFSLSGEYAFLVPLTKNFAAKKLLSVTLHQQIILRTWFVENTALSQESERVYWKMSEKIHDVHALLVDETASKVILISDSKDASKCQSQMTDVVAIKDTSSALRKLHSHSFFAIHDPHSLAPKRGSVTL